MVWPYPRSISETVERYGEETYFNADTAQLTLKFSEGLKSEAFTYKGNYSAATDYVAGDLVWDTDRVWKCIQANGPGSSVHAAEEGAYWTGCNVYSASVDYEINAVVAYPAGTFWKALAANGPGSSVVTPVEGATWTATTHNVNDAGIPYHTPERSITVSFSWEDLVTAVTGEITEDQLLDLFYTQGNTIPFLPKVLYDYLKTAGLEPLPDP